MSNEETGAVVTTDEEDAPAAKCPVLSHSHSATGSMANQHWWPEQLNLRVLNKNSPQIDPMGEAFDYAAEFESLDLAAVKADIEAVMTTSQDWWPADYGHYGPFFIRMAWHSAGTYRIHDGRGGGGSGTQRFAPLNSWPDNANLDKARRLLWPVKAKYGRKLSWADLMILAGNCALESMGFDDLRLRRRPRGRLGARGGHLLGPRGRLAGGRALHRRPRARRSARRGADGPDLREPRRPQRQPRSRRRGPGHPGDLRPDGHGRRPRPSPSSPVATPSARPTAPPMPTSTSVASPRGPRSRSRASAGRAPSARGKGGDTITSGLEGAWTTAPAQWDNNFFENLFGFEWELTRSPAGAQQWRPTDRAADDRVPDAHDPAKRHAPMMLTTDLALRFDPAYEAISRRFLEDPAAFADAFARAWFKLTHRDMGPVARYLGPEVPTEELIWQDPVPAVDHPLVDEQDVAALKATILASGPSVAELVVDRLGRRRRPSGTATSGAAPTAPASASPRRRTGRPTTRPSWPPCWRPWSRSRPTSTPRRPTGKTVSLADLIVLGGCAAVEQAARAAGHDVQVPFAPGRTDATPEQTDVDAFAVMEPRADGFRNYARAGEKRRLEELFIDRASLLGLTAPETTVLVGGLRALGANAGGAAHGVLTDRPGTLTNDVFVNLLDMDTEWKVSASAENVYEGRDRSSGEVRWTATAVDLVFGVQLPAPGHRRGLRRRGRRVEVRRGLRGGLGQGHEPGPVRPGLIGRAGSGRRDRTRPVSRPGSSPGRRRGW